MTLAIGAYLRNNDDEMPFLFTVNFLFIAYKEKDAQLFRFE